MRNAGYTQCLMKSGDLSQVGWIPSNFAKAGESIRLKEDGSYWTIIETWQQADDVPDQHDLRKSHKRATGDKE